jgi:hypothetical protein
VSEGCNDDIDAIEADSVLDGDGGTLHKLSRSNVQDNFHEVQLFHS